MQLHRTLAAFATAGVLTLGAAACGSDSNAGDTNAAAAKPKPVAQIDQLSGQSTAVALDSGFVDALGQLNLKPAPVGKASISDAGVASFPITGGDVTYYKPGTVSPYVQGTIDHNGSGLSLTSADGTTVKLTDFVVDPGTSTLTGTVSVDGKVAAESAPLFFLDGRTLKPLQTNQDAGTAVLQGTTVKLKQSAAELLDKTFGTDALKGGLEIGTAKITVDVSAA